MAKDDDLTLKIGFTPDMASLKRAADLGAKEYANSFRRALSAEGVGNVSGFTSGVSSTFSRTDRALAFANYHNLRQKMNSSALDKTVLNNLSNFIADKIAVMIGKAFTDSLSALQRKSIFQSLRFSNRLEYYPHPQQMYSLSTDYGTDARLTSGPVAIEYKPRVDIGPKKKRYNPFGKRPTFEMFVAGEGNAYEVESEDTSYNPYDRRYKATAEDDARWESWRRRRRDWSADEGRIQDLENLIVLRKNFTNLKGHTFSNNLYYEAFNPDPESGISNAYRMRATQFIKDPKYQRKFVDILDAWGGPEGFYYQPAASTMKYHPLFAHGTGGLARHTDAVMQGVFQDAVKAGYSPEDVDKLLFAAGTHDALKYTRGMPNSNHANDMAFVLRQLGLSDEAGWVETHMGDLTGKKGYGSGAKAPENKYQKLLADTDYLVSRQYAQFYTDLSTMKPDMDKLREASVFMGEGRWIDPNGPHNAENWERTKKSEKEVEKSSKGWLENLRNVGGNLAKIYTLYKLISETVKAIKKFDEKAVESIAEGAADLPNRRYYAGYGVRGSLDNQSASNAIGISKGAIDSDVIAFSSKRGQMSLLGKGFDLLPAAILGQYQNMMQEGDAESAWWNTLDAVASRYNGASAKEKEQLQKLLDDTLGKSATEVLAFSRNTGIPISEIRTRRPNSNWGAYDYAEQLNFELKKVQEDIKASYMALYEAFESAFGIPFRNWWAELLKSITGADENTPFEETGLGGSIASSIAFRRVNSRLKEEFGVGLRTTFTPTIPKITSDTEEAFPVSFWRKANNGKGVYEGEITRYLQGKGVVGDGRGELTSLDRNIGRILLPFRRPRNTIEELNFGQNRRDEVEAIYLADYISKLKLSNPDISKEELEAKLSSYINSYVATQRISSLTDGSDYTKAMKRIANGELGINVYIEMRKDGTITDERLEAAGYNPNFDLIKLNGVPATTK